MRHNSMNKMFRSLIAFSSLGIISILNFGISNTAHAEDLMYGLKIDELEYRRGDEKENLLAWNSDAFIGEDELKLHWLSESEYDQKTSTFEKLENQLVLQIPISTFFDAKAGVRITQHEVWKFGFGLISHLVFPI